MKLSILTRAVFIPLFFCLTIHGATTEHDEKQKTYERLECTIQPINRVGGRDSHVHIPGPKITTRAKNGTIIESSTNWAGYVAVSNVKRPARNSVSKVAGSWTVPSVRPSNGDSYSAFWIGIDGYTSPTVEQIGTAHDWSNGSAEHYAWFEMYPRSSYSIDGFPLRKGDKISATVTYQANGVFLMTLYNDTKKSYVTIPTSYTTAKNAQRSSAEWIVEAPYYNGTLPLANFGTGVLNKCTATINGVNRAIGLFPNIALMMMTENNEPKATTSALLPDNKSFLVSWKGQ